VAGQDENAKSFLTTEYSFALQDNFKPHRDYQSDIRGMNNPCTVLAGVADELFDTEKLEAIFKKTGNSCTLKLLPGIGHIPFTLEPASVDAAVQSVDGLR
jgi:pimeloyl-ACP methyl ester carboxylesterase